ncbi:P1 family peptidase [Caulobacter sp. 17J80-11]|uniref:DmpA family aminopeptidase n=1 Tax=Caulobacter sp. 17J80-11 TaxID=2763502 RepID=UPI00165355CC|nr:P1 family peptidase [Caulobacter sp. 17J80-11]MBC6983158.1 P1 family peptidase [Caulobacter sp. 17J80-11]
MLRRSVLKALPASLAAASAAKAGEAKPMTEATRVRARDIGLKPGVLKPGALNAVTDVAGVRVGQVTIIEGDRVRTGVTAVLPHGGNLFQDKVPAGLEVANGFGKLAGATQIVELGEIETPIVLTNTLAVARGVEAVIDWTLAQPGNGDVRSVNAVVGETNDGRLNDIRSRGVTVQHVRAAIEAARPGPVEEGCVGAGTGTVAFGWKGGIGTSSRVLPKTLGGWTVGVLVQTNYGGVLSMGGAPVGRALGRYHLKEYVEDSSADGSIMIVVATDAPLSDRNLARLARRAIAGLARTGSTFSNGSGDYAIAFSTAEAVRRTPERRRDVATVADLPNDQTSPLFAAAAEATEEAIYNSLLMATTTRSVDPATGLPVVVEALDVAAVRRVLDEHRITTR